MVFWWDHHPFIYVCNAIVLVRLWKTKFAKWYSWYNSGENLAFKEESKATNNLWKKFSHIVHCICLLNGVEVVFFPPAQMQKVFAPHICGERTLCRHIIIWKLDCIEIWNLQMVIAKKKKNGGKRVPLMWKENCWNFLLRVRIVIFCVVLSVLNRFRHRKLKKINKFCPCY